MFLCVRIPRSLSVSMTNSKKLFKVSSKKPDAWLRCSVCFGTGYVFSSSIVSVKTTMGETVSTMTNHKCEDCLGSGFVHYVDG
jgi:hypothetical protein